MPFTAQFAAVSTINSRYELPVYFIHKQVFQDPVRWNYNGLNLSEWRPQNIYSQEEVNLYCIIKLATEISLFSLQISKTWCFV